MKIFSSQQLYEADAITEKKQEISSTDLMERAGNQIFKWLHQRLQGGQPVIHVFCGIGKNGGDGLVVARLLIEQGYKVQAYIVNFSDKRAKDFLINYDRIKDVTKSWPVLMKSEADFPEIDPRDIIIDAIFGIGCNRAPKGWVKGLIQYINKQRCFTLSIDMPSGLTANSPMFDAEAIVKANHTLTFQTPKLAFFLPETGVYCPYFEILDIGLDREYLMTTQPLAELIGKPEIQQLYRQREKFSHKGTFGHTLIVGGSYGKIGAAVLAAKAAYRSGSGLVTAFVPECGYTVMQTAVPEAMVITDVDPKKVTDVVYEAGITSVAVGMGLGTATETAQALEKLFTTSKVPMVIDADAINAIAESAALLEALPEMSILTPHPGELRRLIGAWENDYDKIEKTKAFSKKYNVIVLIKGANTMVIFKEELFVNTSGNPGMATGGMGDVLSGMIAGFIAQGYDPLIATVFATYIHGSSGNIVSHEIGYEAVMAGDVIEGIGDAFVELFKREEEQAPK